MPMQDSIIRSNDWRLKHRFLKVASGENPIKLIVGLYNDSQMSGQEVSDYLLANFKVKITPRSIQRLINKYGKIRSVGDAFRLAGKKGRINWAFKQLKIKRLTLNPKLRYQILLRDNFKCKLCGNTEILEVNHIKPIHQGGTNEPDNLQTLCHYCHIGQHLNS